MGAKITVPSAAMPSGSASASSGVSSTERSRRSATYPYVTSPGKAVAIGYPYGLRQVVPVYRSQVRQSPGRDSMVNLPGPRSLGARSRLSSAVRGDGAARVQEPGPNDVTETNLGVIVVERTLGVGNVAATEVATLVRLVPQLGGGAATEERINDGPAPVGRTATSREEEPVASRLVGGVDAGDPRVLNHTDLRRQRVGELVGPAANLLANRGRVDQEVRVVGQRRGHNEHEGVDHDRVTPEAALLLLGLLNGREQRVLAQRSVRRNVRRHPGDVAHARGSGAEHVVVDGVEVRGVDAVGGDEHQRGENVLGVPSEEGSLGGERRDLVPLVVDERLERELNPRTVLRGTDELLARLVLEGRVRGQLRDARERTVRHRDAAVLALEHRGVRDQLVEVGGAEVVQLHTGSELLPHRLDLGVLVLQFRVGHTPEERRKVRRGDGLLKETLRQSVATDSLVEQPVELLLRLNRTVHVHSLLSALARSGGGAGVKHHGDGAGTCALSGVSDAETPPGAGRAEGIARSVEVHRVTNADLTGHVEAVRPTTDTDGSVALGVAAAIGLVPGVSARVAADGTIRLGNANELTHDNHVAALGALGHRQRKNVNVLEDLVLRHVSYLPS